MQKGPYKIDLTKLIAKMMLTIQTVYHTQPTVPLTLTTNLTPRRAVKYPDVLKVVLESSAVLDIHTICSSQLLLKSLKVAKLYLPIFLKLTTSGPNARRCAKRHF